MDRLTRIAVIDKDISACSVMDLSGREIRCYELHDNIFRPMSGQRIYSRSHGTVCTALLAEYVPETEIIGLSVAPEQDQLMVEYVCLAFEWCLEQKVDIICLSLGTVNWLGAKPMHPLCQQLMKQGTQIICAAGNEGLLTFPAAYSGVIGVRYEENTKEIQRTSNTSLGYDLSVGFFESQVLDRLSCENEFFFTRTSSMAVPYAVGQLFNKKDWSCHAFPRKVKVIESAQSAIAGLEVLPMPFVRLHGAGGRSKILVQRFQSEGYSAVLVSTDVKTDWGALIARVESFADLAALAPSLKEMSMILLDLPINWKIPKAICDLVVDMTNISVEEVFGKIVSAFETQGE